MKSEPVPPAASADRVSGREAISSAGEDKLADRPQVTLYTYALSPFGMKVYWALLFKRIVFQLVYVNPVDQREIAFSQQNVVPVLKIGDRWKQDSRETCLWLEELFPSPSFAGKDEQERAQIIAADEWVTRNLIALFFRLAIDRQERWLAFNNARKLANVLRKTSGGISWGTQFFWSRILNRVEHVRRSASPLDELKSLDRLRSEILAEFEQRLAGTGFLAATRTPSVADLNAYGQMLLSHDPGIVGTIDPASSPSVTEWLERVSEHLPTRPEPELIRLR